MAGKLVLEVEIDRSELDRVASAVEEFGEQQDWPASLVFKIHLALEELVLNVMTHGRHPGMEQIQVTLVSEDDAVAIEIVDDGLPFDPLHDAPAPDLTSEIEDRRVGGLGVFLVLDMADEVNYTHEHGKNHLTLKLPKDG